MSQTITDMLKQIVDISRKKKEEKEEQERECQWKLPKMKKESVCCSNMFCHRSSTKNNVMTWISIRSEAYLTLQTIEEVEGRYKE